jgi:uncharacterized membrane protein YfcA
MSSALLFILGLWGISLVAGFLGALLGLGGGLILVPVLTLGLGIHIRYAIGASLISVIATSSGAAARYLRDRVTHIRIALLLEVATTLGALFGFYLSGIFPTWSLYLLFSGLLFYSASAMGRSAAPPQPMSRSTLSPSPQAVELPDRWSKLLRLHGTYCDPSTGQEQSYAANRAHLAFGWMLGAGILSALLGIGSGVVKVAALDLVLGLPIRVSSATSNFMIGVTAAASAGSYFFRGDVIPLLAAPVALGVFLGALLGAQAMLHLPAQTLRRLFRGVLILVALQMGYRGLPWHWN